MKSSKFIYACEEGDTIKVYRGIAEDAKMVNSQLDGVTPLIAAVMHNQTHIVRIILATDEVDIGTTSVRFSGMSALHYACAEGKTECLPLLVHDRRMTKEIMNAVNENGKTALMLAVQRGHLSSVKEMAKLEGVDWNTTNADGESLEYVAWYNNHNPVLEFFKQRNIGSPVIIKPINRKLKEVADNTAIFFKHVTEKENLKENLEKDIAVLKNEQYIEIKGLARKHRQEQYALIENQEQDKSNMNEKHKDDISKLYHDFDVKLKALALCSTPASPCTPECPVCLETMPPPCKIFTCPNGHLECGQCKERVDFCSICKEEVMGRATAMEQLLRTMYKIE